MTNTKITEENVVLLTRWADEYQVELLRTSCEEFLMKSVPVDVEQWAFVCTHNIPRRAEQCGAYIKEHLGSFLGALQALGDQIPDMMLQSIWPGICEIAGATITGTPQTNTLSIVWPFILAMVGQSQKYTQLFSTINELPERLYEALPAQPKKKSHRPRSKSYARHFSHKNSDLGCLAISLFVLRARA